MPKEENYKHIGAVYSVYFGDDSRTVSYDGASVNSRKKKFKFIFSTVFLPKQQKKYI